MNDRILRDLLCKVSMVARRQPVRPLSQLLVDLLVMALLLLLLGPRNTIKCSSNSWMSVRNDLIWRDPICTWTSPAARTEATVSRDGSCSRNLTLNVQTV